MIYELLPMPTFHEAELPSVHLTQDCSG